MDTGLEALNTINPQMESLGGDVTRTLSLTHN